MDSRQRDGGATLRTFANADFGGAGTRERPTIRWWQGCMNEGDQLTLAGVMEGIERLMVLRYECQSQRVSLYLGAQNFFNMVGIQGIARGAR